MSYQYIRRRWTRNEPQKSDRARRPLKKAAEFDGARGKRSGGFEQLRSQAEVDYFKIEAREAGVGLFLQSKRYVNARAGFKTEILAALAPIGSAGPADGADRCGGVGPAEGQADVVVLNGADKGCPY